MLLYNLFESCDIITQEGLEDTVSEVGACLPHIHDGKHGWG